MGSTKKDNNYPDQPASKLATKAETQPAPIPYAPRPLYFDIANSVHGKREEVFENNGKSDEKKVIKTELCEWQIPPVNKKEDCTPHKCNPLDPSYRLGNKK